MHLAHAMNTTRIEKNTLGRGRFTGINMGNDTDIPRSFDWII
jgi:hypothetical protein